MPNEGEWYGVGRGLSAECSPDNPFRPILDTAPSHRVGYWFANLQKQEGSRLSDLVDMVRLLGTRFVQRRDVKAVQGEHGKGWYPRREPFTMQDFEDHFTGKQTFGHYLVDEEGNCKLFAFDLDLVKHGRECPGAGCQGCTVPVDGDDGETYNVIPREVWQQGTVVDTDLTFQLRCLAEGLAYRIWRTLGIHTAIAASGHKGVHVYGFTGTMPAESVRQLAVEFLNSWGGVFEPFKGNVFWRHNHAYLPVEIEVFPKQGNLEGKDLGNLMALPLGYHRRTGRFKHFVSCTEGLNTLPVMDARAALSGVLPWE